MFVYMLYDVKAKRRLEGTTLFVLNTDEEAKRVFLAGLNQKGSFINKYPRDVQMFAIAIIDDESRQLASCENRDITPYADIDAFEAAYEATN